MDTTVRSPRFMPLWVFLALSALLWVAISPEWEPHSFLHGDGAFYANMNRSLADGFTLAQDDYHPRSWLEQDLGWNKELPQDWSNVSLGADDETWWPKHPYVMPVASTPFYLLLGVPGLLLFNVLQTALLLTFAYRAAARLSAPGPAVLATLAFAVCPVFVGGAYSYNNDIFYGLLVVAAFDALLGERWATSGALLGFAVWAKVTNVFFLAPIGLWLLLARRGTPFWRFSVAAGIPLAAFAISNWVMFGAPWVTSYDRILVRHGGQLMLESAQEKFGTPFVEGLEALLAHPRRGLLNSVPAFFLALPGLGFMAVGAPGPRRTLSRVLAASLAFSLVAYFLFFARYEYVYARFFFPWAGLSVIPLAVFADRIGAAGRFAVTALMKRVKRRHLTAALTGICALALGTVWITSVATHGDSPRLSDRVGSARVTLGDVPCDYLNLSVGKWECSQLDRRAHEYVGLALGEECVFDGRPRRALWLHASSSGRSKRIRFDDLPVGSALRVTYGRPTPPRARAGRAARKVAVPVEVWVDGELLTTVRPEQPGLAVTEEFPVPALADGGSVELRPTGPGSWGHGVCLEAEVLP